MHIYINATGCISAQNTFGDVPFLQEEVFHSGDHSVCLEPDYKNIIDPKMIRRMSRIIRMGVAAATECLREAALDKPDAIITGTAYGCLQDTGIFISRMVEQEESLLTPTAFIQSTHNTIGGQIGLLIGSHSYNNTFVHRGFSFERALQDAILLIREGDARNALVGAVDEITDYSHAILQRFGLYRDGNVSNSEHNGAATIAGEGASFFLLSGDKQPGSYAKLIALETLYKPENSQEVRQKLLAFLKANELAIADIDTLLTGRNGDFKNDNIYKEVLSSTFENTATLNFKKLCGDYPTASAFGLWIAAKILKTGAVPDILKAKEGISATPKRILVYTHYQHIHHSFYLLEAC